MEQQAAAAAAAFAVAPDAGSAVPPAVAAEASTAAAAADAVGSDPPTLRQRVVWSDEHRAHCVRLAAEGTSTRAISRMLAMPYGSVCNILKIHKQQGRVTRVRHGPGHPQTLTIGEVDMLMRIADEHRGWSLIQIAAQFQALTGRSVTPHTVSNRLKKRAKNSDETRGQRMAWLVANHARLTADNTVYFSERAFDSGSLPKWMAPPPKADAQGDGAAGQHTQCIAQQSAHP